MSPGIAKERVASPLTGLFVLEVLAFPLLLLPLLLLLLVGLPCGFRRVLPLLVLLRLLELVGDWGFSRLFLLRPSTLREAGVGVVAVTASPEALVAKASLERGVRGCPMVACSMLDPPPTPAPALILPSDVARTSSGLVIVKVLACLDGV